MDDGIQNSAPCILLVDNSIAFLTLARQYLQKTSARIVEANSCETALEACRRHAPQLIYLAVNLPAPGGVECCRRIKADAEFSQIPVVLVARAKDGDRSDLSRLSNCDAVIGMPLIKQNFLAIGRSFLVGFREHRHDCLLAARLMLQDQQDNCRSIDISNSGAFLEHQTTPSLGQPLQIELQLARVGEMGPRIQCAAQVTWINSEDEPIKPTHPPGFGVKFTDLSPRDAAVLNGFLKSLDAPQMQGEIHSAPLFS